MARKSPQNASALAQQWADAQPLSVFIQSTAKADLTPVYEFGSSDETSSQLAGLQLLTRNLQFQSAHREAVAKAKTKIKNELIAGRLSCLGRRRDSYEIEVVPTQFWIGASIDWAENMVNRETDDFIDLRVVEGQPEDSRSQDSQAGSEPPSVEATIKAAIEKYAESEPDPSLKKAPFLRYRAYRAYIAESGYDPHKDRGFSEKNFQKYEAEYRKRFK